MRVTLLDDLSVLHDEWSELCESDPTATPFASLPWMSAWCCHWGEGGTPWILAVRDEDERLIGAAAFLRRRRGALRLLNGLGVGVGNYWDVVALPGARERAIDAVAAELVSRADEWDAFFLDKLPEESPTMTALRRAGLRTEVAGRMVSPRIELPDSFEEYLTTVSSKSRHDIRRALAKFDEGTLAVRAITETDDLRTAVERWQSLKVEWWRRRGLQMNPEHASARFREFTVEAMLGMVPRGLAEVWEIRSGEEIVAVAIALTDGASYYGWLFSFDWRHERLRPGHLIIAYGIRWSIERRLRYFDFMLGSESYKYHYAPRDRAVLTATVGSPRLRSRAAVGLSRIRRAVGPPTPAIPGAARA